MLQALTISLDKLFQISITLVSQKSCRKFLEFTPDARPDAELNVMLVTLPSVFAANVLVDRHDDHHPWQGFGEGRESRFQGRTTAACPG